MTKKKSKQKDSQSRSKKTKETDVPCCEITGQSCAESTYTMGRKCACKTCKEYFKNEKS